MKADYMEFKTADGGKAVVIASELESIYIGGTGQCSLISLKSGMSFSVDARTATGLIELLGLIPSSSETANTTSTIEVSANTNKPKFKNLFTHSPKPTIEHPYVYTAGLNDELLIGWMEELIGKILLRKSLPKRIESGKAEVAKLERDLNQISSDTSTSIVRKVQDPTPHQGMAQ